MVHEDYAQQGTIVQRLIEELFEVGHAISKAERFGMCSHHPVTSIRNDYAIESEMRDFVRVWNEYANQHDLPQLEAA